MKRKQQRAKIDIVLIVIAWTIGVAIISLIIYSAFKLIL